jgi:hypothetical protein
LVGSQTLLKTLQVQYCSISPCFHHCTIARTFARPPCSAGSLPRQPLRIASFSYGRRPACSIASFFRPAGSSLEIDIAQNTAVLFNFTILSLLHQTLPGRHARQPLRIASSKHCIIV